MTPKNISKTKRVFGWIIPLLGAVGVTLFMIEALRWVYYPASMIWGAELPVGVDIFVVYLLSSTATLLLCKGLGLLFKLYKTHLLVVRKGWFNPTFIVWGVLLLVSMNIIIDPLINLYAPPESGLLIELMQGGLWPMVTSVVVVPMMQEFIFRGTVQYNLERTMGPLWAIVVAAILSGAVYVEPTQAISAAAWGLIFGGVYYWSGSLSTTISVHVLFNGLTYLTYLLFGDQEILIDYFLADETLHTVVYGVALILVVLSFWRIVDKAITHSRIYKL
ncbi:MAG: CPBP family intramembrane glutamic endopeptidase [Mucinivorans sp.]